MANADLKQAVTKLARCAPCCNSTRRLPSIEAAFSGSPNGPKAAYSTRWLGMRLEFNTSIPSQ
jgi:hypothetical protein